MFVVEPGSAKQTQDDVNRLMEAFAKLLDKIAMRSAQLPEAKLPTIAVNQEWEYQEPVQTTPHPLQEGERLPQLNSFDSKQLEDEQALPQLEGDLALLQIQGQARLPELEGFNPQLLDGVVPLPQMGAGVDSPMEKQAVLPAAAEGTYGVISTAPDHRLQIQIGDLQIAGTVSEVQAQLQELSPEQLTVLQEAIQQPVGTIGTQQSVSVAVDRVLVLDRNEQGLMQLNEIPPAVSMAQTASVAPFEEPIVTSSVADQRTGWTTVEAEVTAVDRIAAPEPQPHLEVRPVGEVEVITGQQIGESSSIHDLVVQQAPSAVVTVDDEGKVKPSAAVRDQVEATEDEIETEVQSEQRQAQRLTSEAIAVVDQLKDYFQQTGDRFFIGQDYVFENQPDGVRLLPHDPNLAPISVMDNQIDPPIEPRQYEQLMQRFSSSYERIQVAQGQEGYEQDYELGN